MLAIVDFQPMLTIDESQPMQAIVDFQPTLAIEEIQFMLVIDEYRRCWMIVAYE
jgi:hypothetical protein